MNYIAEALKVAGVKIASLAVESGCERVLNEIIHKPYKKLSRENFYGIFHTVMHDRVSFCIIMHISVLSHIKKLKYFYLIFVLAGLRC